MTTLMTDDGITPNTVANSPPLLSVDSAIPLQMAPLTVSKDHDINSTAQRNVDLSLVQLLVSLCTEERTPFVAVDLTSDGALVDSHGHGAERQH